MGDYFCNFESRLSKANVQTQMAGWPKDTQIQTAYAVTNPTDGTEGWNFTPVLEHECQIHSF